MSKRSKGMGGHQSARANKDEWLTPPALLHALGEFDLDPCAPIKRPWNTAKTHYTVLDDGLQLPWFRRVFLNAPYGNALWLWMERLAKHGTGTALLFARTETKGFSKWVWDEATAILFLKGRLHFHHVNGDRAPRNAGAPSVLAAYGQYDADMLVDSGLEGQFVPLRVPRIIAIAWNPTQQSWREIIDQLTQGEGGTVSVAKLYELVRGHPKTGSNKHWKAKVRQTLQRGPFTPLGEGRWKANTCQPCEK